MKAFSIAGWSGSGKTTLITRLIEHFKLKAKKVVAVKHAPQKYYLEPESTDSFKFLEAGADEVCLVAGKELLRMQTVSEDVDMLKLLETRYADCDILLLEGFHRPGIPLIEVYDPANHDTTKFPVEKLSAIVSDEIVTEAIPYFSRNNINEIIAFMEAYNE